MKNILILTLLCTSSLLFAQQKSTEQIDPLAVATLDKMADVIGSLESCSFKITVSRDVNDVDYGQLKRYSYSEVIFDGPEHLYLRTKRTEGDRRFWFNGKNLNYYSAKENHYVTIDYQGNTISMIDKINESYDIDFPAADFFYPSFTDDILAAFDQVKLIDKTYIDQTICLLIKASNEDMDVFFWIQDDAYKLPKKHLIVYKKDGYKQYEATFSHWKINPNIPSAIFEFTPPANAKEVSILAKKSKN